MKNINILDTVTILKSIPMERLTLVELEYVSIQNLPMGLVGTVVEVYNQNDNSQYLVEFSDSQGHEYAMATLKAEEILVLQYELSRNY